MKVGSNVVRLIGFVFFALILSWCLLPTMPFAQSARDINAEVNQALERFYAQFPNGRQLVSDAAGVLVFPDVVKAGLGVGGKYGTGALLVKGQPQGYYNIAGASIGIQAGVKEQNILIAITTPESLKSFQESDGWQVGANANVTLLQSSAGGRITMMAVKEPVVGVVYDQSGIMAGATLQGAKVTKMSPVR